MGRVIAGRDFLPGFVLAFSSPEQHDEADMVRLRDICRILKVALDAVGDPTRHPLRAIGCASWSPGWQNQLVAGSRKFCGAAAALESRLGALAECFRIHPLADPRWGRQLLALAAQAIMDEAELGVVLLATNLAALRGVFEEWKPLQRRCLGVRGELACTYRDSVFELALPGLLNEWRLATAANVFVRNGRKKRVRQAFAAFTTEDLPADAGLEIARLIDLKDLRQAAGAHDATFAMLGRAWRGLDTNPDTIEALFTWAAQTATAADRLSSADAPQRHWVELITSIVTQCAADAGFRARLRQAVLEMAQAFEEFDASRRELEHIAETSDEWLGFAIGETSLEQAATIARAWESAAAQTQRWCRWREVASAAERSGLAPLVDALASGDIVTGEILYAFDLGYARAWVEQVVERDDVLRTFIADQHEDVITRFAEVDARVAKLARHVVAGRLSGSIPPRTGFGRDPEFGVLAREIEKRMRNLPLRQLFGRMPTALTKLAPCLMMSPLSVAQYLPADAQPLDVVIFDEASQIPVWDAVGAVARGKQMVVVGDPKQLPPTTFFDRSGEDYDDATDLEDLESILDECLGANIPHKRLNWHYRSRYESLIAFSNERYYDGQLVTFPSPMTEDRAVHYVHVHGGVYERGSGRVNREEARRVVREVVARLLNPTFAADCSSLGVVTFNTEQQRLIETLLDQERRGRPELERFFGRDWPEPVLVKNLETVQGDERDVVLFSIGYGPDAAGRVSANFGPLNKDGGARRLNVAITRARTELVVFGTLKPDQIDLSRTKAEGVRDFKHFLEYAERGAGALARAAAPLDRDPESPFEEAVQKMLEQRGWVVHPQVGIAGFRVDLGIVHPDAAGRYLAGIECDGASYHRSATARDRDLLRERVLRDLGWRIYRVWSTDWWVDTATALTRLTAALEADLVADRGKVASEAEALTPALEAMPEPATASTDWEMIDEENESDPDAEPDERPNKLPAGLSGDVCTVPRYAGLSSAQRTEVSALPAQRDLEGPRLPDYAIYRGAAAPDPRNASTAEVVADYLCQIIEIEGPMLAKRAYDIYLRGCGIRRLGGELRTTLNKGLAKAIRDGRVVSENEPGASGLIHSTVWLQGAQPVTLRLRGPRAFEEIPPGELKTAATHVFRPGRMTWNGDEHHRAILELFELKRMTTNVRTRLTHLLGQSAHSDA
jgi:very-short-patch-repair endonuclease